MLSRFHLIPERHGRTDRRTELLYRYRASVCWPTTETSDVLSHGHTVEWPVLWGRRVKSMGEGKLSPLTTPTPLNRQSRNVAHMIRSTISPHTRHLIKIAPGVTYPHIAKVTTHFFISFFLCTQNLSTDLELRPLNRFWHAIHQQTRIHAG